MAQSGYTPILIYASGTTTNVPLAANLTSSASGAELALNYADGKLFYKDSSGVIQVLATKATGSIGGSNTQVQYNNNGVLAGSSNLTFNGTSLTLGGNPTLSAGTANGVAYLNGSKVLTTGSALVFDGTNVGVGVTPSAWYSASGFKALQVGLYGFTSVADGGSAYTSRLMNNSYYNSGGSPAFTGSNYASEYRQTAGVHSWHTSTASGTAGNAITFTQAMTLDASGNLGVGATTGFNGLSGTETTLYVKNTAANVASLYLHGNRKLAIFSGGAGQLAFYDITGAKELGQFDSSGNLLVGTTIAPNATFLCKSNFIGVQASNPQDSTKWRQMAFANNSADAVLYFPNGSNTPTLSAAGAWTNASDGRQKTNITDIKYGLNTVLSAQPHSYNRTDVEGDFIGFVAQELQTVIPEVVFGSDETSYSVDYGSLVAVAFKAIQEQQALITQLQADVAALKA
jgi:hypothetical protein